MRTTWIGSGHNGVNYYLGVDGWIYYCGDKSQMRQWIPASRWNTEFLPFLSENSITVQDAHRVLEG